jgi:hypothetical protein
MNSFSGLEATMTTTSRSRIEPRKPGSVQEAAGFISGGAPVSTTEAAQEPSAVDSPAAPEPMPSAKTKKATMSRRRSGKEVRQLTVYLPPELERKLKLVAVEEDSLPSDVIADALRMYFAAK